MFSVCLNCVVFFYAFEIATWRCPEIFTYCDLLKCLLSNIWWKPCILHQKEITPTQGVDGGVNAKSWHETLWVTVSCRCLGSVVTFCRPIKRKPALHNLPKHALNASVKFFGVWNRSFSRSVHRNQSLLLCRAGSSAQFSVSWPRTSGRQWEPSSVPPRAGAAAAGSRSVTASGCGRLIAVGNDTACHHQAPDQEQSSQTDLTEQRLWTISGASLPGHRKLSLIRDICSIFFDDSTSDSSWLDWDNSIWLLAYNMRKPKQGLFLKKYLIISSGAAIKLYCLGPAMLYYPHWLIGHSVTLECHLSRPVYLLFTWNMFTIRLCFPVVV